MSIKAIGATETVGAPVTGLLSNTIKEDEKDKKMSPPKVAYMGPNIGNILNGSTSAPSTGSNNQSAILG